MTAAAPRRDMVGVHFFHGKSLAANRANAFLLLKGEARHFRRERPDIEAAEIPAEQIFVNAGICFH